jgi:hypothetical protein
VVVATHSHADRPPTRQPVSSATTMGALLTRRRISAWVGTRSVPLRCAAWHSAPALTSDARAGEQAGALGEGQPEAAVQPCRPRLGHRAHLGGGRPEGVGGLLGVAPLHPASAVPAAPDAHPEAGDDRTHLGKLGLELLGVTLVVDLATAVRAARRQRGVELPVGSDRRHAMAVAAVRLAGLAPWAAGSSSGAPLENGAAWRLPERRASPSWPSSLAMRSARRHALGQLGDGRFQAGDHGAKISDDRRQVTAGLVWLRTRHERHRSLGSTRLMPTSMWFSGVGPRYPSTEELDVVVGAEKGVDHQPRVGSLAHGVWRVDAEPRSARRRARK